MTSLILASLIKVPELSKVVINGALFSKRPVLIIGHSKAPCSPELSRQTWVLMDKGPPVTEWLLRFKVISALGAKTHSFSIL